MELSTKQITAFHKTLYSSYEKNGRHGLPWRKSFSPYSVLVSEIMLQQTQVNRGIEKYKEFMRAFPTLKRLAEASREEVLRVWQGLGYNRRALFLKKCAEEIRKKYHGRIIPNKNFLLSLPGIGEYTASAIRVFAFNLPDLLIETNVRTVIIYHFLNNKSKVPDLTILEILEQIIDRKNPRKFYSAIMDYGTHIKSITENPSRKSKHYVRQKPLKGSNREVRGKILKALLANDLSKAGIIDEININDERIEKSLSQLAREGFIRKSGIRYHIIS